MTLLIMGERNNTRRTYLKTTAGLVGTGLLAGCYGRGDETYPDRNIEWWVPFSEGGAQDRSQRGLAPYVEEELGVDLAVQNVPGGGSGVALQELASAEPDGYTISGSFFEFQYLMNEVYDFDYDPLDFEFVYQWARYPFAIAVRDESEWETLSDLIEASQEEEDLLYGLVAAGGTDHLAALRLQEQTEFQGRPVSYESGGETTSALLGGEIDVSIPSISAASPRVEGGDMRLLAIFSPPRDEYTPLQGVFEDVPTIGEIDEIEETINSFSTRGVIAPPGLDEERKEILVEAFDNATRNEEWEDVAEGQDELIVRAGPEEARANFEEMVNDYEDDLDILRSSVEELES